MANIFSENPIFDLTQEPSPIESQDGHEHQADVVDDPDPGEGRGAEASDNSSDESSSGSSSNSAPAVAFAPEEPALERPKEKGRKGQDIPEAMLEAFSGMIDVLKTLPTVSAADDGHLVIESIFIPALASLPQDTLPQNMEGHVHEPPDFSEVDVRADEAFWMQFCSEACVSLLNDTEGALGVGFDIVPEREEKEDTLVQASNKFREQIDTTFGWAGKNYHDNVDHRIQRTATLLSCLLLAEQSTRNDSRSEILHAKIIALLFPEYRSHNEQLFRLCKGVFQRTAAFHLQDLDFFERVCKLAQAVWVALSWKTFQPPPNACKNELSHLVHHMPATFLQYALHIQGGDTWCGEMVILVARLRDEFATRSSSVLRSFHRWGCTAMPTGKVNGANFEDCFVHISRHPKQARKSVDNNVYTTIPGHLHNKLTARARKAIIRFVTTCFALGPRDPERSEDYPDALKTVLAVLALVARGVLLPDVFLIPIGEGGDGKTLFFGHLLKAVFGTGHATLSSRNLQVDREWQQQGEKHIEKNDG